MERTYLALGSVLVLTGGTWLARARAKLSLCPICTGVSATWSWLLLARWAGAPVDPALLAVLLGGSAVAGANWIESRLPARRSPMAWKSLAIPTGLVAAYAVASERWIVAAIGAGVVAVLLAWFMRRTADHPADPTMVSDLEERMKRCC